jgi:hypothetical protein
LVDAYGDIIDVPSKSFIGYRYGEENGHSMSDEEKKAAREAMYDKRKWN